MKNSSLLSLNWQDLVKGLLVMFLTIFLGSILTVLQSGALPTFVALRENAYIALVATLAYFVKNLLSNSDGKFLRKQRKVTKI